jgi:hypothetical protein
MLAGDANFAPLSDRPEFAWSDTFELTPPEPEPESASAPPLFEGIE